MKISIALICISVMLFQSCQKNTSHTDHVKTAGVTLNNGEKWEANPETTNGIGKMAALLIDFPQDPGQDDCQLLKNNLETEFNLIIEKCTMTGEAHNQLHNYLMPLAERIKNLDQNGATSCRYEAEDLKGYIDSYGNYFS